jgi:transposase
MIDLSNIKHIYLVTGYTDMRKQIDGLTSIISVNYPKFDLTIHRIFIFCSRDRTKLKILEVDQTGVWVYYKRTHGEKFIWPKDESVILVEERQLLWLLDGLSPIQKRAHKTKYFDY